MAEPHEVVGPLWHSGEIEDAVLKQLKTWLPTYLHEARRQADFAKPIKGIDTWGVASEFDRFPEQGLPALIIAASGTTGSEPETDGDGYYSATYALEVVVEVSAGSGAVARRVGQIYGAAVRGAILQKRSLGGAVRATDWVGEDLATIDITERRTRFAVQNTFTVQRREIVTTHGGPGTPTPPDELPEEWPEITSVDVGAAPSLPEDDD